MNLADIKEHVMFQTNNDADDLGDYMPALGDYINEGYDRLVYAFAGQHVSADNNEYPPLKTDRSSPNLPDFAHRAIADYATWLCYRNGSAPKQSRGQQYLGWFEAVLNHLRTMTDEEKGFVDGDGNSTVTHYARKFKNLPR